MWFQCTACQSRNYIWLVNSLSHCPGLLFHTCFSLLEHGLFLFLFMLNNVLILISLRKWRKSGEILIHSATYPSNLLAFHLWIFFPFCFNRWTEHKVLRMMVIGIWPFLMKCNQLMKYNQLMKMVGFKEMTVWLEVRKVGHKFSICHQLAM